MGAIQQQIIKILQGNSCGHNKYRPRLNLDKSTNNLPSFLAEACRRIEKFYHTPDMLPELNYSNGSYRQMRSERREAVILVLKTLFYRLDIASFVIGIPQLNNHTNIKGFSPLPLSKLQSLVNTLGKRRFERAIFDLKQSKFLKVGKQVIQKLANGEFQYFPCVRAISEKLFIKLGFSKSTIRKERKAASRRITKKLAKEGVSLPNAYNIRFRAFYQRKSNKQLIHERDLKLLEFLKKCKAEGDWNPELEEIYKGVSQRQP